MLGFTSSSLSVVCSSNAPIPSLRTCRCPDTMADDEQKKKKIPTGALNVERRTWDLEHFEKIAKERLEKVR